MCGISFSREGRLKGNDQECGRTGSSCSWKLVLAEEGEFEVRSTWVRAAVEDVCAESETE